MSHAIIGAAIILEAVRTSANLNALLVSPTCENLKWAIGRLINSIVLYSARCQGIRMGASLLKFMQKPEAKNSSLSCLPV